MDKMTTFYRFGVDPFEHPAVKGTPSHIVDRFAQTFLNIEPSSVPSMGFDLNTYAPRVSEDAVVVTSDGCREDFDVSEVDGGDMVNCHTWFEVDFEADGGWVEVAYGGHEAGRVARISWERVGDHFELTDFDGAKIGFTEDRVWEIISDMERAIILVRRRLFKDYRKRMSVGMYDEASEVYEMFLDDVYVGLQAKLMIERGELPPLK